MTLATKFRQFATITLIAAGAMAPVTQAALSYTDGDLILGFRATGGEGGTSCYEVNIGPVTQFIGASSMTVNLGGNIVPDLDATFGTDWKTRADVRWSVSGTRFVGAVAAENRTLFASKAQTTAGTQSSPWNRANLGTQASPALKMQALAEGTGGYNKGTVAGVPGQIQSTNSTSGLIADNAMANSYASHMPTGTNSTATAAYAYFNGGIEANFGSGTANSVIDLYQLIPGAGAGTLVGSFRMSDAGGLSFSPNPADFVGPTAVKFSSATYTVSENGGTVALTLVRTGDKNTAFTVNFSTSDGSALAGTDFTGQTNTPVAFAIGDTSKTVNVAITDVPGFQGGRSFGASIALASGAADLLSPSTVTMNITEDDPQGPSVVFSAATYSIAEDGATFTVTINRNGSTAGTGSVNFSTTDGTAHAGTDFTGQTNVPVNFAIGDTSKTVDIAITDRASFQGGRSFGIALTAPTDLELATPSTATVTITETDSPPSVQLESATYSVSEADAAGKVTITIVRGGDTQLAFTVTFNASGGTATQGTDYTFAAATPVSFGVGQTTTTVDIPIINVAGFQGGRTFNATISAPTNGATLGTPATAVVTITDDDAAPGGAVAGSYNGIIVPAGAASNSTSGLLTLKITPTNTFTGKVLIGGASLSVSGNFGADGVAKFKPALGATIALATKGKTPVQFGNLALTIFGDTILGTLSNPGVVASIAAERGAFDGKTPATAVNALFLANKGKYTCVLPSKAQAGFTDDQFPQGDGIGTISVSKAGKVAVAGTLPDGTPFKASALLSKNYTCPLFAALYAKKGGIAGVITLSLADIANASADSDLSGADFLWLRPADAKAKYYPGGWPGGLTLDIIGASYRAPQKGDVTSVFPDLGADDLVNGNTKLEFADGKLGAMITKNVNISAKNKVTNAPATDKTFKLTIAAPTGALSGNFTHSDGKKPAFKGIIYQKGPTKGGYGYFLSVVPKGGPTGESGGISILAKP